jgi:hypothetical protein
LILSGPLRVPGESSEWNKSRTSQDLTQPNPQAGGTSVDTQLTPQALANMSDAQFNALYEELMAKGDRQKLMDFVWTLIAS